MFEDLFIKRSHFLGYQLTHNDENNHGWVGGNAPLWFADKEHLLTDESEAVNFYKLNRMKFLHGTCHHSPLDREARGSNAYGFFLSMHLPASDRMLSIFIPERYSAYSQGTYPCNIKVFEHPISKESKASLHPLMPEKPEPGQELTKYQREFDYSAPVISKAYIAPFVKYPVSECRPFEDFIQIGGSPAWVQAGAEDYYANTLLDQGYSYVMQVNEDGYLPEMIHGNYPFCFGALYLYAQVEANSLTNLTAGFWQNS